MKGIRPLILIFVIFCELGVYAQHLPIGAEAAGIGYASVASKGRIGVFGNAASQASVNNKEIWLGYDTRYGFIEGISTISAAYLHPLKHSSLALGISRFGDQLFSQHKLSISYGHQIDQYSMGIRASQHQYHMEGAATQYATVLDMGGIANLLPNLRFGMSISNLNRALISQSSGEKIPTTFSSGICYLPDEKLKTLVELSYTLEEKPLFKAGLAYQPIQFLTFRSGMNTGRMGQYFLGLGLGHSVIDFDYALETHSILGISQQFNVIYKISKDAKK